MYCHLSVVSTMNKKCSEDLKNWQWMVTGEDSSESYPMPDLLLGARTGLQKYRKDKKQKVKV